MQKKSKVVALINQKGGVGKTTMAFHLAHALKNKGHKVLCLDMDPQANLSLLFGEELKKKNRKSIYHLLINSVRELHPLHLPVLPFEVIRKGEIDLLPAGQELSGFELTVAGIQSPRQLILSQFLKKHLLSSYDFIVVDTPPTLGLLVVNVICAVDGVLVPFKPDKFSYQGLLHFHKMLEDVESMGISSVPRVLGYIPNLVNHRRKQEEADLNAISRLVGEDKLTQTFYNRVRFTRSLAKGQSVYNDRSREVSLLREGFDDLAVNLGHWRNSGA